MAWRAWDFPVIWWIEHPLRRSHDNRSPVSTTAVANELVALCRAGRNLDAIAQLYSPEIVSVEMARYTVKDGKIVREQFFYHTPEAEA